MILYIEFELGAEVASRYHIEILNSIGVQVYSKEYLTELIGLFQEKIQVKDWDPAVFLIRLKDSHHTIALKRVVVM